MVTVDDAIRHLADHQELYWEVGFRILKDSFSYPMLGFIHISGAQVEYRVSIRDIVPYSIKHYEDKKLAERVKPKPWLREWKDNLNDARLYPFKNALIMTEIVPFSYDTYSFHKCDGTLVQKPPQGYVRVLPPDHGVDDVSFRPTESRIAIHPTLAERNLEDFIVHQLEAIEPGLRLEKRQLSTPAGRLDLLCKDTNGNYVVVELKRTQGTDQVVGQILRYMGWLIGAHGTDKVRGIIVVAKKDQALSYALMAVPNVQAKEFKVLIE
ncbi:MAG: endonuclease NucS domain-containing protein [Syntrophales bacterium]